MVRSALRSPPYTTADPALFGPAGPSYTCGGAHNNYIFVRDEHKSSDLSSIWNATLGDILYVSWDPKGAPDSHIDHAMIVTQRLNGMPYISQHSKGRHNISISSSLALADRDGRKIRNWYGQLIY